jgi:hypothetical protein
MRAVILVPRRGQQVDYDRAWSLAYAYYATSGYEIFDADSPGERFCLPAARNAASQKAGDWDVAAFINADCLVPIASLKRGFDHALATGHLTVPWDHYYSMTQEGHEAGDDLAVPIGDPVLEGLWRAGSWGPEVFPQPFYAPGGDVIVPRVVWEQLGGAWDERFLGVQPEDAAALIAAGSFDRLSGPAYHFWHPGGSGVYVEADGAWPEYRARYVDLLKRGEFVQRLIDEGREIRDFGGWGW